MKNTTEAENLFSEFSPLSKKQWKELAIEDLKGADYDKKLVWHTMDQLAIEPYYTWEEVGAASYPDNCVPAQPAVPGRLKTARTWDNLVPLSVKDPAISNAMALESLEGGADGVIFRPAGCEDAEFETIA